MSGENEIKKLRLMSGLTQVEFAERYRIPLSTYKRWESGKVEVAPYDLYMLTRLARIDADKGPEKTCHVTEPKSKKHNTIVTIKVSADKVTCTSEYDPDMPDIMKYHDFIWKDRTWMRAHTAYSGEMEDRAAEIGNALLQAGFPIKTDDPVIRKKAVRGNFIPEHKRWIVRQTGENAMPLAIRLERDSQVRSEALRISGAKKTGRYVSIPLSSWREAMDFAELYGLKTTPKAKDAIMEAMEHTEVVSPGSPAEEVLKDGMKSLRNIMDNCEGDILEDLLEDD